MSFIASAILLAKICTTETECRIEEIAHFGNGAVGEQFCQGTAGAINEVDGHENGYYFCTSPGAARQMVGGEDVL